MTKTFYIVGDASKGSSTIPGCIGWVLCQKNDKYEWVPIQFGSRTLRQAEMNYPISTLEALSLLEGYRDCYHIVHGHQTILINDNKPAVDRATKSEKHLMTMLQDLMNDEDVKIEHLPGQFNDAADFLSRYTITSKTLLANEYKQDAHYYEKIVKRQLMDDEIQDLKRIIKMSSKRQLSPKNKSVQNSSFKDIKQPLLLLGDGVFSTKGDWLIPLVPAGRDSYEFVINVHLDTILTHLSTDQMIKRIKEFAFVPDLNKIAKEVYDSCMKCVQNKEVHKKSELIKLGHMPIATEVGQRWHID